MGKDDQTSSMVDHALQYAGRGWRVFPLQGKIPFKGTSGFKEAATDPAMIEFWWAKWPGANIGLATGNGLAVLDVDGAEGLAELKALTTLHGALPATLAARTGNGAHLYFTHAGDDIRSSARGKLHVRGTGGYVVLPPSLHPETGQRYAWIDISLTVAPLPDWLKEWMLSGGSANKNETKQLQTIERPAYLERLGSRGLAARALAAIREAESTWSGQEQKRIESALTAIPADNYESWYKIGMILQSLQWIRSDGSDCGLELWDAWSSTCDAKYPGRGGLEAKWQSFGRGNRSGLGLGTLFALAQDHGWSGGEVHADVIMPGANAHAGMNGHAAAPAVLPNGLANGLGAPSSQPIYFDVNDAGFPKPTAKNARAAIQALGIACSHDTFHDRMTVGGRVLNQFVGEISDNTVHVLRVMIEQTYRFDPKLENLHDAVVELALQNQFDPVADYLDGLQWDGTQRLDTWLVRYLGAMDTPLVREMGRKVLMAAVRRVYEPGTKFDQIIVLEGPEGKNKSTAVRILAGDENFSDQTILTLNDRQQQEQMEGVWLYEIADLTGISRADVEKVKAFASRQIDRARAAYARKRTDRARRCIFFATTNEQKYLASQTGNRRFWPIACGHVDVDGLRRDRDQLWAEACAVEAVGGSIGLAEAMWGAAREMQEARREVDPWDMALENLELHHCTIKDHPREWRIVGADLLQNVLKIPMDRQYNVTAKRLAYAMERAGWEGSKPIRVGDKVWKGYTKPK